MIRPLTIAAALAAGVLFASAPAVAEQGEELPPGAPTDSYQLAAWCYGALSEYLTVYDRVIPDLKDIDKMFGTSVVEDKPYKSDMAAARVELKLIGDSVTAAEKASPTPLTSTGLSEINEGRSIWSVAERKTRRELARAWLLWALPDACDANAKDLTKRSLLLGTALKYNTAPPAPDAAPAPETPATAAPDAPATAEPATPKAVTQNPGLMHESPDAIDAFIAQKAAAPADQIAPDQKPADQGSPGQAPADQSAAPAPDAAPAKSDQPPAS
jgi:hypothetical protein